MHTAHAAAGPGDASLTASLTSYVADFIVSTRASDIPPDVGCHTIEDGHLLFCAHPLWFPVRSTHF